MSCKWVVRDLVGQRWRDEDGNRHARSVRDRLAGSFCGGWGETGAAGTGADPPITGPTTVASGCRDGAGGPALLREDLPAGGTSGPLASLDVAGRAALVQRHHHVRKASL
jgi:hypothetical protein